MSAAAGSRGAGRGALGAFLLMVSAAAAGSRAEALDLRPRDFGLRGGVSLAPDQVRAGVDTQLDRGTRWHVRPSVEAGVGNGVRLLAVHGDVLYPLGEGRGRFRPYVGAGPVFSLVDVTDGVGEARGVEADLAATALAGVRWGGRPSRSPRSRPGRRYLAEVRAGLGDTPDLVLTAGVSF